MRLAIFPAVLAITCSFFGCSKTSDKPSENSYTDSAVVILHTEENYTIKQGKVETHAVCRYTTYNVRGEQKAYYDHCLKALPVGKEIKIKRGEDDWLFANWEEGNTQWHMGLSVEKEEMKQ